MNKRPIAALIPSIAIMVLFVVVGVKTMYRYADTPGDWHFIAAAMGTFCFLFMLMVIGGRLYKRSGTA